MDVSFNFKAANPALPFMLPKRRTSAVHQLVRLPVKAFPCLVIRHFAGDMCFDVDSEPTTKVGQPDKCVGYFILKGVFDVFSKSTLNSALELCSSKHQSHASFECRIHLSIGFTVSLQGFYEF